MSKKKNNNKNTEEVKNIINNMNEQINEMKQKMSILMEQLAETEEKITNVTIAPPTKEKKKKQKAEKNIATDIPIETISDKTIKKEFKSNKKMNSETDIQKEIVLIDTNNKIVKTRNKKTKAQTFQNERKIFIDELEKKMGLTETKRGVLLYDLEHNEELMKFLKDNIPEIQKLYKCGSWNYFIKLNSNSKVSEIGLLKSIFKTEQYSILNKQVLKEIEGIKKMYSELHFIKI